VHTIRSGMFFSRREPTDSATCTGSRHYDKIALDINTKIRNS
jgi:hypothetical protein